VPVIGRQPAVMPAQQPSDAYEAVPSNPTLLARGAALPPQYVVTQAPGPFPDIYSNPDATSQSPATVAAEALKTAGGAALYASKYAAHPSPAARFLGRQCDKAVRALLLLHYMTAAASCVCFADECVCDVTDAQAWNDDACFPRLTATVGVTHDAYGNRLLSDRGQAVPAGTLDAAGVTPPVGTVVPGGAFTAPTLLEEQA
jgi:hypothetical protein